MTQKFKSPKGSTVLVWTPRGKLAIVPKNEVTNAPPKFMLIPAKGSASVVAAGLGKRLGWSTDTSGVHTCSFRNKDQRHVRFENACEALGVGKFANAAFDVRHGYVWFEKQFNQIVNPPAHAKLATQEAAAEEPQST